MKIRLMKKVCPKKDTLKESGARERDCMVSTDPEVLDIAGMYLLALHGISIKE